MNTTASSSFESFQRPSYRMETNSREGEEASKQFTPHCDALIELDAPILKSSKQISGKWHSPFKYCTTYPILGQTDAVLWEHSNPSFKNQDQLHLLPYKLPSQLPIRCICCHPRPRHPTSKAFSLQCTHSSLSHMQLRAWRQPNAYISVAVLTFVGALPSMKNKKRRGEEFMASGNQRRWQKRVAGRLGA